MVPLPRAITAKNSHVFICSGLAAVLNAMLLPAAVVIHVRRITVSYSTVDSSVRYSRVTTACMGLQSLWLIAFFSRPNPIITDSVKSGTVGPLQQQLGIFFSRRRLHSCRGLHLQL